MAPEGVPRKVMAVMSHNSCSVAVAAEIDGMVKRTRLPLLPLCVRQKRTGVPVRAAFEVVRMEAMRTASIFGSVGGGNWRISSHLVLVKVCVSRGAGFTFLLVGGVVGGIAGALRAAANEGLGGGTGPMEAGGLGGEGGDGGGGGGGMRDPGQAGGQVSAKLLVHEVVVTGEGLMGGEEGLVGVLEDSDISS